jgi:THAP domain
MVRKCVVPGCIQTDVSILAHRFPRRKESAVNWQTALGLDHIPLHDLVAKHVVCTEHFKTSDYRNAMSNSLNFTACPSLNQQPTDYEIIDPKETDGVVEIVAPPPPQISRIPRDVVIRKIKTVPVEEEEDNAGIEVIEISEEPDDIEDLEIDNEIILVRPQASSGRSHKFERGGLPKNVLHLYPSTSDSPATKRKRSPSPDEENLPLYANVGVQTDGDPDEDEIARDYPQYKEMTKLELAKLLKGQDEKIRELDSKCDKLKKIIQNW